MLTSNTDELFNTFPVKLTKRQGHVHSSTSIWLFSLPPFCTPPCHSQSTSGQQIKAWPLYLHRKYKWASTFIIFAKNLSCCKGTLWLELIYVVLKVFMLPTSNYVYIYYISHKLDDKTIACESCFSETTLLKAWSFKKNRSRLKILWALC